MENRRKPRGDCLVAMDTGNDSQPWIHSAAGGVALNDKWAYGWNQMRARWHPDYFLRWNSPIPTGNWVPYGYHYPDHVVAINTDVNSGNNYLKNSDSIESSVTSHNTSSLKKGRRCTITWCFILLGILLISTVLAPIVIHIVMYDDPSDFIILGRVPTEVTLVRQNFSDETSNTSWSEPKHVARMFEQEISSLYSKSEIKQYFSTRVNRFSRLNGKVEFDMFFNIINGTIPSNAKLRDALLSVDRDKFDSSLGVLGDLRFRIDSVGLADMSTVRYNTGNATFRHFNGTSVKLRPAIIFTTITPLKKIIVDRKSTPTTTTAQEILSTPTIRSFDNSTAGVLEDEVSTVFGTKTSTGSMNEKAELNIETRTQNASKWLEINYLTAQNIASDPTTSSTIQTTKYANLHGTDAYNQSTDESNMQLKTEMGQILITKTPVSNNKVFNRASHYLSTSVYKVPTETDAHQSTESSEITTVTDGNDTVQQTTQNTPASSSDDMSSHAYDYIDHYWEPTNTIIPVVYEIPAMTRNLREEDGSTVSPGQIKRISQQSPVSNVTTLTFRTSTTANEYPNVPEIAYTAVKVDSLSKTTITDRLNNTTRDVILSSQSNKSTTVSPLTTNIILSTPPTTRYEETSHKIFENGTTLKSSKAKTDKVSKLPHLTSSPNKINSDIISEHSGLIQNSIKSRTHSISMPNIDTNTTATATHQNQNLSTRKATSETSSKDPSSEYTASPLLLTKTTTGQRYTTPFSAEKQTTGSTSLGIKVPFFPTPESIETSTVTTNALLLSTSGLIYYDVSLLIPVHQTETALNTPLSAKTLNRNKTNEMPSNKALPLPAGAILSPMPKRNQSITPPVHLPTVLPTHFLKSTSTEIEQLLSLPTETTTNIQPDTLMSASTHTTQKQSHTPTETLQYTYSKLPAIQALPSTNLTTVTPALMTTLHKLTTELISTTGTSVSTNTNNSGVPKPQQGLRTKLVKSKLSNAITTSRKSQLGYPLHATSTFIPARRQSASRVLGINNLTALSIVKDPSTSSTMQTTEQADFYGTEAHVKHSIDKSGMELKAERGKEQFTTAVVSDSKAIDNALQYPTSSIFREPAVTDVHETTKRSTNTTATDVHDTLHWTTQNTLISSTNLTASHDFVYDSIDNNLEITSTKTPVVYKASTKDMNLDELNNSTVSPRNKNMISQQTPISNVTFRTNITTNEYSSFHEVAATTESKSKTTITYKLTNTTREPTIPSLKTETLTSKPTGEDLSSKHTAPPLLQTVTKTGQTYATSTAEEQTTGTASVRTNARLLSTPGSVYYDVSLSMPVHQTKASLSTSLSPKTLPKSKITIRPPSKAISLLSEAILTPMPIVIDTRVNTIQEVTTLGSVDTSANNKPDITTNGQENVRITDHPELTISGHIFHEINAGLGVTTAGHAATKLEAIAERQIYNIVNESVNATTSRQNIYNPHWIRNTTTGQINTKSQETFDLPKVEHANASINIVSDGTTPWQRGPIIYERQHTTTYGQISNDFNEDFNTTRTKLTAEKMDTTVLNEFNATYARGDTIDNYTSQQSAAGPTNIGVLLDYLDMKTKQHDRRDNIKRQEVATVEPGTTILKRIFTGVKEKHNTTEVGPINNVDTRTDVKANQLGNITTIMTTARHESVDDKIGASEPGQLYTTVYKGIDVSRDSQTMNTRFELTSTSLKSGSPIEKIHLASPSKEGISASDRLGMTTFKQVNTSVNKSPNTHAFRQDTRGYILGKTTPGNVVDDSSLTTTTAAEQLQSSVNNRYNVSIVSQIDSSVTERFDVITVDETGRNANSSRNINRVSQVENGTSGTLFKTTTKHMTANDLRIAAKQDQPIFNKRLDYPNTRYEDARFRNTLDMTTAGQGDTISHNKLYITTEAHLDTSFNNTFNVTDVGQGETSINYRRNLTEAGNLYMKFNDINADKPVRQAETVVYNKVEVTAIQQKGAMAIDKQIVTTVELEDSGSNKMQDMSTARQDRATYKDRLNITTHALVDPTFNGRQDVSTSGLKETSDNGGFDLTEFKQANDSFNGIYEDTNYSDELNMTNDGHVVTTISDKPFRTTNEQVQTSINDIHNITNIEKIDASANDSLNNVTIRHRKTSVNGILALATAGYKSSRYPNDIDRPLTTAWLDGSSVNGRIDVTTFGHRNTSTVRIYNGTTVSQLDTGATDIMDMTTDKHELGSANNGINVLTVSQDDTSVSDRFDVTTVKQSETSIHDTFNVAVTVQEVNEVKSFNDTLPMNTTGKDDTRVNNLLNVTNVGQRETFALGELSITTQSFFDILIDTSNVTTAIQNDTSSTGKYEVTAGGQGIVDFAGRINPVPASQADTRVKESLGIATDERVHFKGKKRLSETTADRNDTSANYKRGMTTTVKSNYTVRDSQSIKKANQVEAGINIELDLPKPGQEVTSGNDMLYMTTAGHSYKSSNALRSTRISIPVDTSINDSLDVSTFGQVDTDANQEYDKTKSERTETSLDILNATSVGQMETNTIHRTYVSETGQLNKRVNRKLDMTTAGQVSINDNNLLYVTTHVPLDERITGELNITSAEPAETTINHKLNVTTAKQQNPIAFHRLDLTTVGHVSTIFNENLTTITTGDVANIFNVTPNMTIVGQENKGFNRPNITTSGTVGTVVIDKPLVTIAGQVKTVINGTGDVKTFGKTDISVNDIHNVTAVVQAGIDANDRPKVTAIEQVESSVKEVWNLIMDEHTGTNIIANIKEPNRQTDTIPTDRAHVQTAVKVDFRVNAKPQEHDVNINDNWFDVTTGAKVDKITNEINMNKSTMPETSNREELSFITGGQVEKKINNLVSETTPTQDQMNNLAMQNVKTTGHLYTTVDDRLANESSSLKGNISAPGSISNTTLFQSSSELRTTMETLSNAFHRFSTFKIYSPTNNSRYTDLSFSLSELPNKTKTPALHTTTYSIVKRPSLSPRWWTLSPIKRQYNHINPSFLNNKINTIRHTTQTATGDRDNATTLLSEGWTLSSIVRQFKDNATFSNLSAMETPINTTIHELQNTTLTEVSPSPKWWTLRPVLKTFNDSHSLHTKETSMIHAAKESTKSSGNATPLYPRWWTLSPIKEVIDQNYSSSSKVTQKVNPDKAMIPVVQKTTDNKVKTTLMTTTLRTLSPVERNSDLSNLPILTSTRTEPPNSTMTSKPHTTVHSEAKITSSSPRWWTLNPVNGHFDNNTHSINDRHYNTVPKDIYIHTTPAWRKSTDGISSKSVITNGNSSQILSIKNMNEKSPTVTTPHSELGNSVVIDLHFSVADMNKKSIENGIIRSKNGDSSSLQTDSNFHSPGLADALPRNATNNLSSVLNRTSMAFEIISRDSDRRSTVTKSDQRSIDAIDITPMPLTASVVTTATTQHPLGYLFFKNDVNFPNVATVSKISTPRWLYFRPNPTTSKTTVSKSDIPSKMIAVSSNATNNTTATNINDSAATTTGFSSRSPTLTTDVKRVNDSIASHSVSPVSRRRTKEQFNILLPVVPTSLQQVEPTEKDDDSVLRPNVAIVNTNMPIPEINPTTDRNIIRQTERSDLTSPKDKNWRRYLTKSLRESSANMPTSGSTHDRRINGNMALSEQEGRQVSPTTIVPPNQFATSETPQRLITTTVPTVLPSHLATLETNQRHMNNAMTTVPPVATIRTTFSLLYNTGSHLTLFNPFLKVFVGRVSSSIQKVDSLNKQIDQACRIQGYRIRHPERPCAYVECSSRLMVTCPPGSCYNSNIKDCGQQRIGA